LPQFLYARFAYAIFPLLTAFFSGGKSLKLAMSAKTGARAGIDQEIVDMPAKELTVPRPRSASLKKRWRKDEDGGEGTMCVLVVRVALGWHYLDHPAADEAKNENV
jgi:hypothetical protein